MSKCKMVKVERGETPQIEEGARVTLIPGYGSGTKYFVCELSKGFCLIADSKRDCNEGLGYIHSIYNIASYQVF